MTNRQAEGLVVMMLIIVAAKLTDKNTVHPLATTLLLALVAWLYLH